jgi:hypothetical protein
VDTLVAPVVPGASSTIRFFVEWQIVRTYDRWAVIEWAAGWHGTGNPTLVYDSLRVTCTVGPRKLTVMSLSHQSGPGDHVLMNGTVRVERDKVFCAGVTGRIAEREELSADGVWNLPPRGFSRAGGESLRLGLQQHEGADKPVDDVRVSGAVKRLFHNVCRDWEELLKLVHVVTGDAASVGEVVGERHECSPVSGLGAASLGPRSSIGDNSGGGPETRRCPEAGTATTTVSVEPARWRVCVAGKCVGSVVLTRLSLNRFGYRANPALLPPEDFDVLDDAVEYLAGTEVGA